MTQLELSRRMGRCYQGAWKIANGRTAITPDTAIRLSRVLGRDPEFWLRLEYDYRLALARRRLEARAQEVK
jgi:addiction module HigA family antidote